MRSILFSCALLYSVIAVSQDFPAEANVPAVSADGFYRIAIPADVGSLLNPQFSNIRIFDNDKTEIPYILQEETPKNYTEQFRSYEIVEKIQKKNYGTVLILRNPNANAINNIHLAVKNAAVTKYASLLGSDDKENWFALKEKFSFSTFNNPDKTSEVRILDFPLSNYTYYKLEIGDSASAPLNILHAGYFEVSTEDGKFTEINPASLSKSDSAKAKKTYLHLAFNDEQVVDRISLSMKGAPYFLRRATLFNKAKRQTKKGETIYYYEHVTDFELSSKQVSVVDLSRLRTRDLLFVIENNDNPPLQINSVKVHQLNRYLTAWLMKDKTYKVKIGDHQLNAPVYDLDFFRDSIPENPVILKLAKTEVKGKKETTTPSPTFFTSQWYIWGGIIAVIVVLGFMAVKMINETNKRDSAD